MFGQRQQRKVRKRPSTINGGVAAAAAREGEDKVERLERKLEVLEASLSMRGMSVDEIGGGEDYGWFQH